MCGFVGILKTKGDARKKREQALKMSAKIRHRGPDWSGVYSSETAVLAHERLAIVDPLSGGQPLWRIRHSEAITILTAVGPADRPSACRATLLFTTFSICDTINESLDRKARICRKRSQIFTAILKRLKTR